MRRTQARAFLLAVALLSGALTPVARASTLVLTVAEDNPVGYKRNAFKHWIDADKDGCDTRAEVLIEEAVEKPKIGTKCKLTGGKWISAYDGKTITNASQLDVDHLVPLAEAWRSGAWKWTPAQRQAYANDLENAEALIAVTLTSNRSKGDKDPSLWLPSIDSCNYTQNWIAIKVKYALTVDAKEAIKLNSLINSCGLGSSNTPVPALTPTPIISATPTVGSTQTNTPTPVTNPSATPSDSSTPIPFESSSSLIITPGAFCSPAGAIGKSKSGVSYTCKTSPTDTRNRWRQ